MTIAFKRVFLALLTTLFVSAMPLQAAYVLADDAKTIIVQNDQQACSTLDEVLTPENRKTIEDAKGEIIELDGVRAKAFQSRVEDLVGAKAPFTSEKVVLVRPDGADDTDYNIAFFVENCLKAIMHLPSAIVPKLLAPSAPGEKV